MISTNLERLQESNERIKSNIANAYSKCEEKGAELPAVQNSENLADTIRNISQEASKGWQPEPDWWDIDKILEEDTEDYEGKIICMINDALDTIDFNTKDSGIVNKAKKIVMSDGTVYENPTFPFTHTWNKEYDKDCSLGYKTRYFIMYYLENSLTTSTNTHTCFQKCLSIVFKNLNINANSVYFFNSFSLLHYMKLIDCTINASTFEFTRTYFRKAEFVNSKIINVKSLDNGFTRLYSLSSIKNMIDNMQFNSLNNMRYCFQDSCILENIEYIDTSLVTNFQHCFYNDFNLKTIENLDFYSATNVDAVFSNCINLIAINNVENIKINGINISSCVLLNHDTLIRFLNALYNYSNSEETYAIIFGATNLAKLTDEELAIAQNKGWTVS